MTQKTYTAGRIEAPEHMETLSRLWRENLAGEDLPDEIVERRMRWFHEENPAGPSRTWLGYHGPEQTVIGSASFYPRDTVVSGHRLRAGILGDFAVDRAHRIAGAAMCIQREIARSSTAAGAEFLYAFPNTASLPIFLRAGYKKIGIATMWVKPLVVGYKVQELAAAPDEERREAVAAAVKRVTERMRDAVPIVDRWQVLWDRTLPAWLEQRITRTLSSPDTRGVRAAVRFADRALQMKDLVLTLRRHRAVHSEVVSMADRRFDDLWVRATLRHVVGERSSDYLNWRYASFKTTDYHFFCMTSADDGRLIGYAVYSVRANKAVVADLFCDDTEATFDLLVLKLCERMRQEGYDAVCIIYAGSPWFGQHLRALGFVERALTGPSASRWLIVHVDPSFPERIRNELIDPEKWYMPDGELDA